MMFSIEKNVPLPERSTGPKKQALRLAMEAMKVGDSMVVHGKSAQHLYGTAKAIGFKCTVRAVSDGGNRIWRTA